jgi:hypothetical protein
MVELNERWRDLHRPMKQRHRNELRHRMLEELELERPFSFLSAGETITLHQYPTGEPVLFTDGEGFYIHGTNYNPFYLSYDGKTVCRHGDGLAVYWADQNFLYAYADPTGHGPALYFDAAGQQQQRTKHEEKVKQRERVARQMQEFDDWAARRPPVQQEQQMKSAYRNWLQRLFDFLWA